MCLLSCTSTTSTTVRFREVPARNLPLSVRESQFECWSAKSRKVHSRPRFFRGLFRQAFNFPYFQNLKTKKIGNHEKSVSSNQQILNFATCLTRNQMMKSGPFPCLSQEAKGRDSTSFRGLIVGNNINSEYLGCWISNVQPTLQQNNFLHP